MREKALSPEPQLCDACWTDVLSKRRVIAWLIDNLENPRGV
jgi:hypothetical protein